MGLATGNTWTGSYSGATLDGYDLWPAITTNAVSPRNEILHELDGDEVSMQVGMLKLDISAKIVVYFQFENR